MKFSKHQLFDIAAKLKALPIRPEKQLDLTTKESVQEIAKTIQAALEKGYSHADVAKILSDENLKLSAGSLRTYLRVGTGTVVQKQEK